MQTDAQAAVPGEPAQWIERLIAEVLEIAFWMLATLPFILGVLLSFLVDGGFFFLALGGFLLGLVAWVFLVLQYRDGRSAGKRVVGIRVVRADGQPPSWAYNFIVRALLVKYLVISVAGEITFGIFPLVNYLWPLWDDKRQAGHDKMVDTFVVKARRDEPGAVVP